MAKAKNNVILADVHGMFGKQIVLRTVNGKPILSKPPDFSNVVWSEKQIAYRKRFKMICAQAKAIAADPVLRIEYEKIRKPGQTVYNVVLKDLMQKKKTGAGS